VELYGTYAGVRGTFWIVDANARLFAGCRDICMSTEQPVSNWAPIAIACRKHASMNNNAQQRTPITMQRLPRLANVCRSFRCWIICQVTGGGASCCVTSVERTRDLSHGPCLHIRNGKRPYGVGIGWFPSMTTTGARDIRPKWPSGWQARCPRYRRSGDL